MTLNLLQWIYRRHGNFHGRNISWIKFSRESIFVGGCSHEILNSVKIFVVENFTCAQWPKQSQYQKVLYIRGYHVYDDIWEVAVGETVERVLEPGNFLDKNTVSVTVEKDGRIIGYLPKGIARPSYFSEDRWNHLLHCEWKTVGKQ